MLLLLFLPGCGYVRLLRPSVLKQLNPRVVRLVNEFPALDNPNEAIIARLPGHGGLAHAAVGRDGVMRAAVRVPDEQFIWEPALVVLPRGGELELRFSNEDHRAHAVMLEGTDGEQILDLPMHTGGTVRVRLDQPGLYKFTCPVANHGTRGMLGLILVRGEVPADARLDRPAQRRPGRP
ncbi:MAG: MSMEG_3727 family PQQ-associated protein [Gemmatimonadaceae bacterium]